MVQSTGRSTTTFTETTFTDTTFTETAFTDTTLTEITAGGLTAGSAVRRARRADAAVHLYEQECALHDAHGSGVAAWIARAEQSLHAAILTYEGTDPA